LAVYAGNTGLTYELESLDRLIQVKPYWALLSDAANSGKIEQLTAEMLKSDPLDALDSSYSSHTANVELRLGDLSEIAAIPEDSDKEITLNRKDIDGVVLAPISSDKTKLYGRWKQNGGRLVRGTITKLSGGNFVLSLVRVLPRQFQHCATHSGAWVQ
jgi:hypothetical protein